MDMERVCYICKESKNIYEFHKKGEKYRQSMCKICQRIRVKKHYESNKERYRTNSYNYKKIVRDKLNIFKETLKCSKCDENHIATLDFHHNDPAIKDHNVSSIAATRSWESVKKEIEKCTILCANCHRKLHWDEKKRLECPAGIEPT